MTRNFQAKYWGLGDVWSRGISFRMVVDTSWRDGGRDRSQVKRCCSILKMWATVSLTESGGSQPMFWP